MATWTNAQLNRWMLDAEEDIVSEVSMRMESFSIAIVAGQALYTLNTRLKEVFCVMWKGRCLYPMIGKELHGSVPEFSTLEGTPQQYQISFDGIQTLRLSPIPNESISAYASGLDGPNIKNAFIIRGWTYPQRSLDHFQIPDYLHRNLIKCYTLSRAYKAEGVGQNLNASQYWYNLYLTNVQLLAEAKARFFNSVERLDIDQWQYRRNNRFSRDLKEPIVP